jgi:predicted ATPase
VARDLIGAYPDGVWLAELASLSRGEFVVQALAEAVGVQGQPGRPITDTLVDALRTKKMLLILAASISLMPWVTWVHCSWILART